MKEYQVEGLYNGEWKKVSTIHNTLEEIMVYKKWMETKNLGKKTEFRIVTRDVTDWEVLEI